VLAPITWKHTRALVLVGLRGLRRGREWNETTAAGLLVVDNNRGYYDRHVELSTSITQKAHFNEASR